MQYASCSSGVVLKFGAREIAALAVRKSRTPAVSQSAFATRHPRKPRKLRGEYRSHRKPKISFNINKLTGGEGGIRTPGTLARTSHFECDAIDHSATSPHA